MSNGDDPSCPLCGHPLDIGVDPKTGRREAECKNLDCPSNTWKRVAGHFADSN